MQKMVKFKLSRECREIAVNPAKVLYVCHYDHGATSLHFGKECVVRVKGELDDVMRRLETAIGEDGTPEARLSEPSRPAAKPN